MTASGGLGRFRLGSKRIAWPDWVRASAVTAKSTATGGVSSSFVFADVPLTDFEPTAELPNSISIAISQGIDADSESDSPLPITSTVQGGDSGEAVANAPLPIVETTMNADSGEATSDSPIPAIETVHDSVKSEAKFDASIPSIKTIHDVSESDFDTRSPTPVVSTVSNTSPATGEALGSIGIVTWTAGLGGVVKDPSGKPVNGAEVHIIRDNDDTKVATTTTSTIDGNSGRWHVELPAGKTTDDDPEVYSINVWYREGDKRDSDATIYNATNRPYIDTADASESTPYDKHYYSDGDG